MKDDDVVGAVQLNASRPWGYAHTVVYMFLAKDSGEEAVRDQGCVPRRAGEEKKKTNNDGARGKWARRKR